MNEHEERLKPVARPGKRAAIVLAVVVHVGLALFLIYGVRWQNSQPEAVEVDLVRSVPSPGVKAQTPPEPPKPEPKLEPPKPKVEPPLPKPVMPPKPDIAIKDKKPEKKPEPATPSYDPIKEMLKREETQKQRQQASSQMSNAASKELSQLQAAASSKSNRDSYVGKIARTIRGWLVVPPGVSGNPEAEFRVSQLPSGEIIDVVLKRSSGNKALDDAMERAIRKSSPLPKPDRPSDFERQLDLKFRPLDSSSD